MKRTGISEGKNKKWMTDVQQMNDSAEALEYELTVFGKGICAAAGLMEEILVFLILELEFFMTPLPVFLVLWAAFAIITSGLMSFAVDLYEAGAGLAVSGFTASMPTTTSKVTVVAGAVECEYTLIGEKKVS